MRAIVLIWLPATVILILQLVALPACHGFTVVPYSYSIRHPSSFRGDATAQERQRRRNNNLSGCNTSCFGSLSSSSSSEDDDDDGDWLLKQIASNWLQDFQTALSSNEKDDAVLKLLVDDNDNEQGYPFWRDMLAFTWNIITLEGVDAIRDFLQYHSQDSNENKKDYIWALDESKEIVQTINGDQIEFWATLQNTAIGSGRAHVRLKRHDKNEKYQAQTLLTVLYELHNRPFQTAPYHRPRGTVHGPIPNRPYWHETQTTTSDADDEEEYYVVIIGGGQAGLALSARLQALQVPYIVLEAGAAPGSAWRNRYPSLHLHDPCYYNHMPYLPFPVTWPIHCPRDKIAAWLELYAQALDLKVQCRARVVSAVPEQQDNNDGTCRSRWTVTVMDTTPRSRDDDDSDGSSETTTKRTTRTRTIRCQHIVFATGNSSFPRVPHLPGQDIFKGLQLHSSQYKGGKEVWNQLQKLQKKNKKGRTTTRSAVVIGSNNSAFDICQDLWEQQVVANQITMIQRSPGMVVSTDSVLRLGLGPLYSENDNNNNNNYKLEHEEADLIATTVPYKVAMHQNWPRVTARMAQNDRTLLQGMDRAGYQLHNGPANNGAGIFAKSATEGGGFYINMGCAELIMRSSTDNDNNDDDNNHHDNNNNHVNVQYATVERLQENGVVIRPKKKKKKRTNNNSMSSRNNDVVVQEEEEDDDDDDKGRVVVVPADLIVYATGFGTLDEYVAQICGPDICRAVGRTWGLGLGVSPKDPGPWQGELRNMWKPTQVDGLWFQGGNLAQNRHYSRFLALQLAARYMGMETNVYGIPEPTPPRLANTEEPRSS